MVNLKLIHEATKRFRSKMRPISIKTQRNIYKSHLAANMGKKANPQLAAKKAFYKHMYLLLKQREQQLYSSRARTLSMKR